MKFDYIIIGGSLAGCLTAVLKRRGGYRVALVERRGFLGNSFTASLRLYEELKRSKNQDVHELLALMRKEDGDILEVSDIKRRLLDWIEDNGVEVFFSLEPCAVFLDKAEKVAKGLLLGGKWGYFLLEGRCIIDAEATAPIKRMIDGSIWEHEARASMVLRFDIYMEEMAVPEAGELMDLVTKLENKWPGPTAKDKKNAQGISYRIYRQGKASFLEVTYPVERSESMESIYLKGQEAVLLSTKLLQRVIGSKLNLVLLAYEPFVRNISTYFGSCNGVENLYHICVGDSLTEGLEQVTQWIEMLSMNETEQEGKAFRNRDIVFELCDFEKDGVDPCERPLPLQKLVHKTAFKLPVLAESDVVVAGGGVAGVAAAIGAAREGVKTVVVEYLPGFGGTQTYGGIHNDYFCFKRGFANQHNTDKDEYGIENSCVGRMLWHNHTMAEEEICMYNGASVCDVVRNCDTITGVVVIRNGCWGIIRSDVAIDATGDGDLIYFAGIKHQLGASDTGNVQDSGIYHYGGYGYNLDAIYQSKYEEVLRGIRMGHRIGGGIDFSPFLTPREGRLFEGEYTLTMQDVLLHRNFTDTIALACTDNDPHGEMSSLISYMGVTPFHGEGVSVEIPYRCCIPKTVKGLLAASKSISAAQDAACYLRMSRDIQNRAYAIGVAGAMATIEKCDVRNICIELLQNKMRHMEILNNEVFNKAAQGRKADIEMDACQLNCLLSGLKAEKRDCLGKVLCMPKDFIVPKLKSEFKKEPESMVIGLALAWFGETEGLQLLKKCLMNLAEQEIIDDYDDKNLVKPGNNLGGFMEDNCDYWRINQLLIVFALLGEKNISEDVLKLLDRFTSGGTTMRDNNLYVARRWDLHKIPHSDRLNSLLFYINHVPSPIYGEALARLVKREHLEDFLGGEEVYNNHNRNEEDRCVGRQYQSACMELAVGETLYKCGVQMGREILERGLVDVHYILRKRAFCTINDKTIN